MSTTVLDALLNAQINFKNAEDMQPALQRNPVFKIATNQLNNALEAIKNDMSLDDIIQESLGSEIKTFK